MAHLIDKDALVAEIKKHQAVWEGMDGDYCKGQRLAYSDVLSFLNTLEVKEVDLEEEIDKWYINEASKEFENVLYEDIEKYAKYFFELGLKAQKGE